MNEGIPRADKQIDDLKTKPENQIDLKEENVINISPLEEQRSAILAEQRAVMTGTRSWNPIPLKEENVIPLSGELEIERSINPEKENLDIEKEAEEMPKKDTAWWRNKLSEIIDNLEKKNEAPVSYVTNLAGLHIELYEPHIYSDQGAKHLFVFGGSPADRAKAMLEYLTKNTNAIIYGADANSENRVPWSLVDGKLISGAQVQVGGSFGFFKSLMGVPGPEEFQKLVK